MRKASIVLLSFIALVALFGCSEAKTAPQYELADVHPVAGRQGVCTEAGYYWVSGSDSLTKYDSNWNVVAENTNPFEGYDLEVNHIGDIDVFNNELYLGVEYFIRYAVKPLSSDMGI